MYKQHVKYGYIILAAWNILVTLFLILRHQCSTCITVHTYTYWNETHTRTNTYMYIQFILQISYSNSPQLSLSPSPLSLPPSLPLPLPLPLPLYLLASIPPAGVCRFAVSFTFVCRWRHQDLVPHFSYFPWYCESTASQALSTAVGLRVELESRFRDSIGLALDDTIIPLNVSKVWRACSCFLVIERHCVPCMATGPATGTL